MQRARGAASGASPLHVRHDTSTDSACNAPCLQRLQGRPHLQAADERANPQTPVKKKRTVVIKPLCIQGMQGTGVLPIDLSTPWAIAG